MKQDTSWPLRSSPPVFQRLSRGCPRALGCLATAVALGVGSAAVAGNFYSWKSTVTNNSSWSLSGNWTPAGVPGTTPGVADDTAAITSIDFTSAYALTLDTNASLSALTVTDVNQSTKFGVTLNVGLAGSKLRFTGLTPSVTANLNDQTLTIASFDLDDTASGVTLTKSGVSPVSLQMQNNATVANVFRALGSGGLVYGGSRDLTLQMPNNSSGPLSVALPQVSATDGANHNLSVRLKFSGSQVANTVLDVNNSLMLRGAASGFGGVFLVDGLTANINPGASVGYCDVRPGTGTGGATSTARMYWKTYDNGGLPIGSLLLGDQSFGGENRFVFDPGAGGTLSANSVLLGNLAGVATARSANTYLDVYSGTLTVSNDLAIANSSTTAAPTDVQTGVVTLSGGALEVLGNVKVGNATASGSGKADLVLTNGGTLRIYKPIITGNGTNTSANNRAIVWLNGGTIQAMANITNLFQLPKANDRIYLNTNGAVFDCSNFFVSITNTFQLTNSPSGGLTLYGNSGTLVLSGSNYYTGTNYLAGGNLCISDEANWGGATTPVIFDGGTLQVAGTTLSNLDSHPVNWDTFRGGFNITASNHLFTVSNVLAGPNYLNKSGSGTLLLTASNSFSGGVGIFSGPLRITDSSALGTGPVSWNYSSAGDTRLELTGGLTVANPLALRERGFPAAGRPHILNVSGTNLLTGALTLTAGGNYVAFESASGRLIVNGTGNQDAGGFDRPLYLQGAGDGELNGAITDSGGFMSLVKEGAGVWTVNAAMDLHRNVTVNGGALVLGPSASLNNCSTLSVNTNGTLDVSPVSGGFAVGMYSAQTLNGAGTVKGDVVISGLGTLAGKLALNANALIGESGTLSPGGDNVAGTLTVVSNLLLNANAVLSLDVNVMSPAPSSVNDLLAVGGQLNLAGTTLVNLRFAGGVPQTGTNLVATFGTLAGSPANLVVNAPVAGYNYQFTTAGNSLFLVVTTSRPVQDLAWLGDGFNNLWNVNSSYTWTNLNSHAVDVFYNADRVLIDDRTANTTLYITGSVIPSAITVSNNQDFTLADGGAGSLAGSTGITKSGTGNLSLYTPNTFTGPVVVNGGAVTVSAVNGLGVGTNLTLNNATFRYSGGGVGAGGFGRELAIGPGGATLDFSGFGGFFATGPLTGSGPLLKTGPQQLVLGTVVNNAGATGSNSYTGLTIVDNGNVQLRNAYALGSPSAGTVVTNMGNVSVGGGLQDVIRENFELSGDGGGNGNGVLFAQDNGTIGKIGGTITLVGDASLGGSSPLQLLGPVTGPGKLTKISGNTLALANDANSYAGGTEISFGTLQLGTNGASGSLPAGTVVNNANLTFNRSDVFTFANAITGSGTVSQGNNNQACAGTTVLGNANDFTGGVTINNGTLRITHPQALGDTNGATALAGGGSNTGVLELAGGITVLEPLTFAARGGLGNVLHLRGGSGTNVYAGIITVQGGGSGYGIGSTAGGALMVSGCITNPMTGSFGYSRPLDLVGDGYGEISGEIQRGTANFYLCKQGLGTWRLSGTMNFTDQLLVSNGTLQVDTVIPGAVKIYGGLLTGTGTIAGPVNNYSGVISAGSPAGIGTMTVSNHLTLAPAATVLAQVSKTDHSADLLQVTGTLDYGNATLVVSNLAGTLVGGETFTLFSATNYVNTITNIVPASPGPGLAWTNRLALDGTLGVLAVSTVSTAPCYVTNAVSGSNLVLNWPADHIGWQLQVQTNALNTGLKSGATNWFVWPGADTTNSVTIPVNKANPAFFLRLVYTNAP